MDSKVHKWFIVVLVLLAIGSITYVLMRDREEPYIGYLPEMIVATDYVGDGLHTVEGAVDLPTPCYTLEVNTEVRESFPEQVLLRFVARDTAEVCVQVVYEAPFEVSFEASDKAEITATFNGEPVEIIVTNRPRVSANVGENFTLSVGEERWVEDIKVLFAGVEQDSRWVRVRAMLDGEEALVQLPGGEDVPNAAVVGSYIITLVKVEPEARSDVALEESDYQATFRLEIHDIKG